jgi:hypothetical protein
MNQLEAAIQVEAEEANRIRPHIQAYAGVDIRTVFERAIASGAFLPKSGYVLCRGVTWSEVRQVTSNVLVPESDDVLFNIIAAVAADVPRETGLEVGLHCLPITAAREFLVPGWTKYWLCKHNHIAGVWPKP